MAEPIRVDVWSDIACPWCYIGKRKLERGIEMFATETDAPAVDVVFHSYELTPDMPVEYTGTAVDFLVELKGLGRDQVEAMHEHITRVAAEVDLAYDFSAQKPANTRKAHEVLHLAAASGRQLEIKERLLSAHFEQGRDVGSDDELATIAVEGGLERDAVLAALRDGTYRDAVDADIAQARQLGISGVPFFVLDGRYGISGAQQPTTFRDALITVRDERSVGAAS